MAERGGAFLQYGPSPSARQFVPAEQLQAVGYEKAFNKTTFEDVVASMPGDTHDAKVRAALDETLGQFGNSEDQALRFLADNYQNGLLTFSSTGLPVGPRAFAGAMRASYDRPDLHPLFTQGERAGYELHAARSAGQKNRNKRAKSVVAAEKQALAERKRQAFDLYGTTDLRKVPKAGTMLKERKQQARSAVAWARKQAFKNAEKARSQAARQAAKRVS